LRRRQDSRIVHQQIDGAAIVGDARGKGSNGRQVGKIQLFKPDERLWGQRSNAVSGGTPPLVVAAGNDDIGAALREGQSDLITETAGSAGNDSQLSRLRWNGARRWCAGGNSILEFYETDLYNLSALKYERP